MPEIRVVLVEPFYEINIGYTARVMKNFDVNKLFIVNPRIEIGEIARRFAMKGVDVLEKARIVKSLTDAISSVDLVIGTTGKVSNKILLRQALTAREFAEKISNVKGKIAILFGREPSGLTNEELMLCDYIVTIPANPEYPILNLSHAVSIILYEIFLTTRRYSNKPITVSRRYANLVLDYVSKICDTIGLDSAKTSKILMAIKRIIYKANPTEKELRTLLLFMRKIYVLLQPADSDTLSPYF